ncbi:sodium-dependent transporter [Streptomyces sp. NPDC087440]|uniref:sodium-dependent transporter n=1 Tax=Streptomyces sp. NPDC087440 TaxID=3365790 RepID=UPI003819E0CE
MNIRGGRSAAFLHRQLGRAVCGAYLAALVLPGPGTWLRHPHALVLPTGPVGPLSLHTGELLLALVLFSAGLQVPLPSLARLVRRPGVLLTGLGLHLAAPLLVIPPLVVLLRGSPDADGGSGLVTAMILIVTMPVAAGATVWTSRGQGDQPVMVGLVLASTLVSPLTVPLTVQMLAPLLGGGYADTLATAGPGLGGGSALTTVALPCAAGLLCRALLPKKRAAKAQHACAPVALLGSLLLTYVNASGALGSFLARPRPVLLVAAVTVAALVCALTFALGRLSVRALRLDAPVASSFTLACGMNNSSASAVLLSTALPDKPHLLLPVLAYGLLQKTAASRVVRTHSPPGRPGGRPCVTTRR